MEFHKLISPTSVSVGVKLNDRCFYVTETNQFSYADYLRNLNNMDNMEGGTLSIKSTRVFGIMKF